MPDRAGRKLPPRVRQYAGQARPARSSTRPVPQEVSRAIAAAWRPRPAENMMAKTRTETDTFGPIEVPADRYWGAQTQRSLREFPHRHRAHAAAADPRARPRQARRGRGQPRSRRCSTPSAPRAIVAAAQEVIDGKLDDHFPLVVWQTGSGTQTNMNVNEVIANRANETARRQARRQVAGASERSRQHEPVVERQLPDRDAHRGGRRDRAAARSRRWRICRTRCSARRRHSPRSSRSAAPTCRTRRR